ncbi:hypothetical protein [Chamaesiphon sp. OTE_75_metabat_556]|uniref:hypothetical protein n=1 Tax=Chamaesiphon sp. OTE_75_metabat_556 TaxID=2964692 RepID=UPI0037BF92DF
MDKSSRPQTRDENPGTDLSIQAQAEQLRPLCACGCGSKLPIPTYLQSGVTLHRIQSYWQKHLYLKGHGIWERRKAKFIADSPILSTQQLGLIYGTLLGDGSITYPNKHSQLPRLAWTHGISQQDWMASKASRLSELRPKLQIVTNQGYGQQSCTCQTACHPQLSEVFKIVKPTGKGKTVNIEWLQQIDLEGLSWWYFDDGSLSLSPEGSPTVHLHTEGYSLAENELIASWLTDRGYPADVKSYKRGGQLRLYYYIGFNAKTSRQWLADLQPYSIPSMAYKFGNDRICEPRWGGKSLRSGG